MRRRDDWRRSIGPRGSWRGRRAKAKVSTSTRRPRLKIQSNPIHHHSPSLPAMEQQANAPPEARAIVNYLRNSSSIPLRNGLLGGTRYYYFHGTRAVSALLSPAYAKLAAKNKPPLPVPKTETEAEQILHGTLPFAFFLRVERGDRVVGAKKPDGSQPERMRELKIVQQQMFKKEMVSGRAYARDYMRLSWLTSARSTLPRSTTPGSTKAHSYASNSWASEWSLSSSPA